MVTEGNCGEGKEDFFVFFSKDLYEFCESLNKTAKCFEEFSEKFDTRFIYQRPEAILQSFHGFF
jgi:hypothetical protein